MTFEERRRLGLSASEEPAIVGQVVIQWKDELPSSQELGNVRDELRSLLRAAGSELERQPEKTSIVFTLADFRKSHPAIAAAADELVVTRATTMGAEMKRLAQLYESNGGRLLTPEEIEREVAERRGAA